MDATSLFIQEGPWHMGGGWGWWMLVGWLWMLAFWALVIWAVVYLTRRLAGPPERPAANRTALEILEERYARGELTDDEFERARQRILRSGG